MKEKLFNDIAANIQKIKNEIHQTATNTGRKPENITLMAVTKTIPANEVNKAIAGGITLLGESKAQELEEKFFEYNTQGVDIHFIGHLQSNKVRNIIDKVSMIHSVDRLSLLKEINKRAKAIDKVMDILIQVNIGREDTKSGVLSENVLDFAQKVGSYPNVRLRGLMAIPPMADTLEEQEHYFSEMHTLLVDIQEENRDNRRIDVLSTGMSGDFQSAIKHGATIVRIGTAIFGNR